jgi:hypothetical protein
VGKGIFFLLLAWGGKGKEEKKEGEKRGIGESNKRKARGVRRAEGESKNGDQESG